METLLFINPEIQAGLNLTVRNGTKWADRVQFGDAVVLQETGGNLLDAGAGLARILGTQVIDFENIRDVNERLVSFLQFEHDPSCRQLPGLIKALDEAYPDGWGPKLTLVFFVPAIVT